MSYRRKRYHAKRPGRESGEQQTILPAVEYSNPGVSRSMPASRLTSGLPYQRTVDEDHIDYLIQKWDNRLLTPIIVSFRDGKFNVVDGQHRVTCMRRMAGDRDVIVPCLIYDGMTYEEEAELCYKLDEAKSRLSLSQATKALTESRTDAEILEIKRLVENNGFEWALGKKFGEAYEITVTRSLINAYRFLGGAAFSRMLCLIAGTWRGAPGSLKAPIFSGVALFLKTYETEVSDHIFIRSMSVIDPDAIIRRGKADFSASRAALRYARVILEQYNSQQHGGRKLPYRFKK